MHEHFYSMFIRFKQTYLAQILSKQIYASSLAVYLVVLLGVVVVLTGS